MAYAFHVEAKREGRGARWGAKHGKQVGVLTGRAGATKVHCERCFKKDWQFLQRKTTHT